MTRIRFIGTGALLPGKDRMASSLLVEGDSGGLLIDAGEGCCFRLAEPRLWQQEIKSILLTHCHPDHVTGLPMLIAIWKRDRRIEPLEIFAPRGLGKGIKSWLSSVRLSTESLPFPVQIKELVPGKFKTQSGHSCFASANGHLPSDKRGRGGSYSLILELNEGKCVFSSDIAGIDDILPLLPDSKLLVSEAFHIEKETVIEAAKTFAIEKVVFTHIPENLRMETQDSCIWAYDNMILELE